MTHKRTRLLSFLILALGATSCGTSRTYFRPAENAVTEAPDGHTAATYELGRDAERVGELRVWCEVARRDRAADRGLVPIRFEIENSSDGDLEFLLGQTSLRAVRTAKGSLGDVPVPETATDVRISPDSIGRVEIDFILPAGVSPRELQSFRVRWAVRGASGRRFEQFTSFVRFVPTIYYRPTYYLWGGPHPFWPHFGVFGFHGSW